MPASSTFPLAGSYPFAWRAPGPKSTVAEDAAALLYARHRVGDVASLGDYADRLDLIRGWLEGFEQPPQNATARRWLVHAVRAALLPAPPYRYAWITAATGTRRSLVRFERPRTAAEQRARRPMLAAAARVRAALDDFRVHAGDRTALLAALGLLATRGGGRPKRQPWRAD